LEKQKRSPGKNRKLAELSGRKKNRRKAALGRSGKMSEEKRKKESDMGRKGQKSWKIAVSGIGDLTKKTHC